MGTAAAVLRSCPSNVPRPVDLHHGINDVCLRAAIRLDATMTTAGEVMHDPAFIETVGNTAAAQLTAVTTNHYNS